MAIVKRSFSGLTDAYLRAVEHECSILSMGEDAVPLDRVYVMLEALTIPKPRPLEPRPDLPDVPERQEHAGLADFPKDGPSSPPLSLSKVLTAARHLSLLGEPGSGKSTTLQFISLCFARPNWAKAKLALDEPGVPVLVKLGETGDRLQRPETRLLDGVVIPIVRGLLPEGTTEAETHDVVMNWMAQGRLVLLLDGLDEVSGEAIRKKVALFAADPNGHKCRIVMSSRPAGYSSPSGEFAEYRLKPFEKPEEARSYLQGWLATLRPEWEPQAENKARALLDEMGRNPTLKRITDNPLLLRLAAEGYAADEQVARNRADLYRRYVERVAWQRRESTRQTPPEQKTATLATLEAIAWKLQQGSRIPWDDNDPQQVLLRRQLGLLAIYIDAGKAYLTFSHTTFREYFIARHLAKAWQQKDARVRAWSILKPRLHDPAWRESLLLLVGMLEIETATDLVQRVLKAHSRYEKELLRDLRLAAAMADECGEKNLTGPMWKKLQRRLQVRIYQISMVAIKEIGDPHSTSAFMQMLNENSGVRRHAAEVLGKIGVQAVPALLQALRNEDNGLRGLAAIVLGKIGDSQAVPALLQTLQDEDYSVRRQVAEALGEIGDERALPVLLQELKDKDSVRRSESANVLGKIGDAKAVPALLRTLQQDEDKDVRLRAARSLGEIGDPQAVPALMQALREDEYVCWQAAGALGKIGAPAVPVLLQALQQDEDKKVRAWVVGALWDIGDARAFPALLQALKKDEDEDVRMQAAAALGEIGDPQAVPALLQALKIEGNEGVRAWAAGALGEIGDPQAVPALLQALKDESKFVRGQAAAALAKIGAPAVPALLQALEDNDEDVRWRATAALGEIGDPQAIPTLLQALKEEEEIVRREAASYLGKIGDPQAVPALLQTLQDEDYYVRRQVAEVLGEIGDVQAVPALLQALEDNDEDVRWRAAKSLEKIGGQVKGMPTLKDIVSGLCRAGEWMQVESVAIRLEALQAGQHPLLDPLVVLPVPAWNRFLARFRLWAIWAVVIVILGLLLLFSNVLGDLVKAQWTSTLQSWAATHLGALIGLFIVVLLIGGLLTFGLEVLQDSLRKK